MFVYHTKRRDQYYDKVISIYQETGYGRKRIAKMVPVGEKKFNVPIRKKAGAKQ